MNREWPIVETERLEEMMRFFRDKLSFKINTVGRDIGKGKEIELSLSGFRMILRQGNGGCRYDVGKKPLGLQETGSQIVLYVPVFNPKRYLQNILINGARPLTQILLATPYLDHSFEGFYFRDIDDNVICFFRDYHGPCIEDYWDWCWEPQLTQDLIRMYEEKTRIRRESNLLFIAKKFSKRILNFPKK